MKSFYILISVAFLFLISIGMGLAQTITEGPNPCRDATVDQVKPAQDVKAEASKARALGDLSLAAAKYEQAAKMHPKNSCAASYLMNAEGCLVSANKKGSYRIDKVKALKNSLKAYELLDEVENDLVEARELACDCEGAPIEDVQAWHDEALKWLEKIAPDGKNHLKGK